MRGGPYNPIERLRAKLLLLNDDPEDFEGNGEDLELYGQPPLEIIMDIDEAEAEEKEVNAEYH